MAEKVKKAPSRSLLKSLTYGSGAFLFDSVNAFTPHGSGAVDIMAVRQKDGQIKSSPFYVRFGKYQSFRRNRQVRVKVNGVLMDFHLELGQYGSAFFAHTRDEVISDGEDNVEGCDDDDHSLGMMSPVAAYEADYMSLVQGSGHDASPAAIRPAPRRRPASASASNLSVLDEPSPPTTTPPPHSASLPIRNSSAPSNSVLRSTSGPITAAMAPISISPATPASPPILAAPSPPSSTPPPPQDARLRCGHDWRDLDRSCTPRTGPPMSAQSGAAEPGSQHTAASTAVPPGDRVAGDLSGDAPTVPGTRPPSMLRGDSCSGVSGPVSAEDMPDSAAAMQDAAERHVAAAQRGPPQGPRQSIDAAYRQLGFEARRGLVRSQPGAAGVAEGGPAEGGLVVRLIVDTTGAPDGTPHVYVRISPWARNVSLLSAAGLACIRTSLDRSTSSAQPALFGDPSIDFAAAAAGRHLGPMSSFVGGAGAPASAVAAEASDRPSDTDDSSLDDTTDEEEAGGQQKHASAPPDIGGVGENIGAGAAGRGGHARHASFRSWAGVYGGLGAGRGAGADEDDVVLASSPHAERMQIGASAMHDEEVQTNLEASVLAEALEATGLRQTSGGGGRGDGEGGGVDGDCRPVGAEGEEGADETVPRSSNEGEGIGEREPEVELAACAHMLSPDVPASALAALFEEHRVSAADVADRGDAALQPEKLVVRLNSVVYRYTDAAPLLVALQVFGGPLKRWQKLVPAEGYDCPKPQAIARKLKRQRTWWASMFWGASSRDASRAAPAAGSRHGSTALTAEVSLDLEGTAGNDRSGSARSLHGGDDALPATVTRRQRRTRRVRHVKVQSTHPTSEQLQAMAEHLQPGQNTVEFVIGRQRVQSFIHLFNWNIRLVVSDIDGTITRSDVLGHVLTPLGVDWTHPGVTRLFSNVAANGYQFVYLSSRSIAQSGITRAFLETLKQQDHGLPAGPVIISPHGIIPSLYREMILKRPEEFKMAALQGIRSLFPDDWNPFYCGFGNRGSDDISYLHVGVPPHRIFTINPAGRVRQLSEPAASGRFDSLTKIDDQVDLLFPVTETARRRLFAAQASGGARSHPTAAAATAAASAAAAASLSPSPRPAAGVARFLSHDTPEATDAATAAAVAAGDPGAAAAAAAAAVAAHAAADGAGDEVVPPPNLLGTRLVPMESPEAAIGLVRLTREGSEHSFDAQVDVDARDEFNDNNFWKAGISMDSVAAAELEELLASA